MNFHHMMRAGFHAGGGGRFERDLRCYPMSFFAAKHQRDLDVLEAGDKIIMPPSALHRIASIEATYPLMFKVTNSANGRFLHCGVLEFSADEGHCYMPNWAMQNMMMREGMIVHILNVTLPKGSQVTFQPQSSDFLKITNPRAVLEMTLRNYSALTKGETVRIVFNNKTYFLDVVEVGAHEPIADGGISIVETDVSVEFAPPPDLPPAPAPQSKPAAWHDEEDPDPTSSSSDDDGEPRKKRKHTKPRSASGSGSAASGAASSSSSAPATQAYTGTGYSLASSTPVKAAAPAATTPSPSPGSQASPAKADESPAKVDYFQNLQSKGYKLKK